MNCICGQKSHRDQVRKLPVGTLVAAVTVIKCVGTAILSGTRGRVVDHCEDGRAIIEWNPLTPKHTYHYPFDYIKPMKAVYLPRRAKAVNAAKT